MNKKQTIVGLLIKLDRILKLETREDVKPYFTSADSGDKILRAKYATKIYATRKLLGLSLTAKPGALFPKAAEEEDIFTDLVEKNQKSSS